MIDITEYRRLKFFEALRFVLALAVCLAAMAAVAFSSGCAGVPEGGMPNGAYDFVTNADRGTRGKRGRSASLFGFPGLPVFPGPRLPPRRLQWR